VDWQWESEEIDVDGIAYKMYIDKDQVSGLNETPDESFESVRFLPYEDSMVKGYKESRWTFFDQDLEKKIISRGGELRPSVWIDGTPAGIFHLNNKQKILTITMFDSSKSTHVKQELDDWMKFSGFKTYVFKSEQEDVEDEEIEE
jgi:hypothetical protein